MLVRQLPPEAALWRSIDPEGSAWTMTNHLLAALFDAVQAGNWQQRQIWSKASTAMPSPLPRPGLPEDGERFGAGRGMSVVELRRRLASRRHRAD